jgi:hypothetical protein
MAEFKHDELPSYPGSDLLGICGIYRVSDIHFYFLQEKIYKFLSEFEGLKNIEWKQTQFLWNIDHGFKHFWMEWPAHGEQRRQAVIRQKCALLASHKATQKDLYDEEQDDYDSFPLYNWSNLELRIYKDPSNGDIILCIKHIRGDSLTSWPIMEKFEKYLKDNMTFWVREQFLKLANGTEIDYEDYIQRYMLNELIVRDICSYLDSSIKIQ